MPWRVLSRFLYVRPPNVVLYISAEVSEDEYMMYADRIEESPVGKLARVFASFLDKWYGVSDYAFTVEEAVSTGGRVRLVATATIRIHDVDSLRIDRIVDGNTPAELVS